MYVGMNHMSDILYSKCNLLSDALMYDQQCSGLRRDIQTGATVRGLPIEGVQPLLASV